MTRLEQLRWRNDADVAKTIECNGKKRDFKDEDNMKLCFIHITFRPAYMLRNAERDTVNDLDFLTIIKHEIIFMMHG